LFQNTSLTVGQQFSLIQETKDKVEYPVNSSQIFGITGNFKGKYSETNCDKASLNLSSCIFVTDIDNSYLLLSNMQAFS
jgi:hypothetical protein